MEFQAQQELEEQRMLLLIRTLQKVARGLSNEQDSLFLASELGLTTQYKETNNAMER